MKKFVWCFLVLIMAVVSFGGVFKPSCSAYALEDAEVRSEIENQIKEFLEVGEQEKERFNRIAGSDAEKKSAQYIHSELSKLTNFKPVNNISTQNGIQQFDFINSVSGKSCVSQNIIFRRDAAEGEKKVILSAHYDTEYVFTINQETVEIEGLNDNGASVALLLYLAKTLDGIDDLGYGVEIVFFGAGKNQCAGSQFYDRGISDEAAEDILLVVNFDKIALGDKLYMYIDEFKTPQQSYYSSLFKKFKIKNIDLKNINETNVDSLSGLNYSHIALESDNAVFMKRHINVLSFFAGCYEKPIVYGHNEFSKGEDLTYTANDNYAFIAGSHPEFMDNVMNVFGATKALLTDEKFAEQMSKSSGVAGLYNFWTNEKLAAIITLLLLAAFWVIYVVIYNNLQKKSRENISGKAVEKIIIKITKNLGEDDDEITKALDQKIKNDTSADNDKDKKQD